MIPRTITAQTIASRESWSSIMEAIKKYWDEGYYITDFDYGGGYYRVVMSKGTGWNGQAIRFGETFPKEKIQELWDKGYYITNAMHDGKDWIVVMSGVEDCRSQSWFTRTNWNDFKDTIKEYWDKDMVVTKLACKTSGGTTVYCGIVSKMTYSQEQKMKYYSGTPTPDIIDLCEANTILTDFYDVDGGVFAVTASKTGWEDQTLGVKSSWDSALEFIKKYWDRDYSLTTLSYYNGIWLVAMSK